MSPRMRRSWTTYLLVFASALVMFPLIDVFARGSVSTWLGVTLLVVTSYALFWRRKKLRTGFLLPLIYVPALAATHFRMTRGIDAAEFTVAAALFIVTCIAALLIDAFWGPYEDDLAEFEDLNQIKD